MSRKPEIDMDHPACRIAEIEMILKENELTAFELKRWKCGWTLRFHYQRFDGKELWDVLEQLRVWSRADAAIKK